MAELWSADRPEQGVSGQVGRPGWGRGSPVRAGWGQAPFAHRQEEWDRGSPRKKRLGDTGRAAEVRPPASGAEPCGGTERIAHVHRSEVERKPGVPRWSPRSTPAAQTQRGTVNAQPERRRSVEPETHRTESVSPRGAPLREQGRGSESRAGTALRQVPPPPPCAPQPRASPAGGPVTPLCARLCARLCAPASLFQRAAPFPRGCARGGERRTRCGAPHSAVTPAWRCEESLQDTFRSLRGKVARTPAGVLFAPSL